MPSKRKFSSRFPTARIKKIMQLDEEIGKVAATVPPVVSRALELFIESLVSKTVDLASSRNSKTITPSHIKHVVECEPAFSFASRLVSQVAPLKTLTSQVSVETVTPLASQAYPPVSGVEEGGKLTIRVPGKRGRPRKVPLDVAGGVDGVLSSPPVKKKRGRRSKAEMEAARAKLKAESEQLASKENSVSDTISVPNSATNHESQEENSINNATNHESLNEDSRNSGTNHLSANEDSINSTTNHESPDEDSRSSEANDNSVNEDSDS